MSVTCCHEATFKMAVELALSEEQDPIPLISFPNGRLNPKAKGRHVKLSLYREKEERLTKRRLLMAETDHMKYIGRNYHTVNTLTTPTYNSYYIGMVDRESGGVMSLRKADMFHMLPFIEGSDDSVVMETNVRDQLSYEEYSSTFDKIVSSFGSTRAKKAWSASKRNKIGEEVLNTAIAPAMEYAENVISENKEEEIPNANAIKQSLFIPPCNLLAKIPQEVYQLSDIINTDEMDLLLSSTESLKMAISDELHQWREEEKYSMFVLSHLSLSSTTEQLCILQYCEYLVKMYKATPRTIEKWGLSKMVDIPSPLQVHLLDKFTENGPQGRAYSQRMKDKVLAHLFVLALMIEGYELNTEQLQKDLLIRTTKMNDIFRALGCTIVPIKQTSDNKLVSKCYNISLKIPLSFPTSGGGKKRRFKQ